MAAAGDGPPRHHRFIDNDNHAGCAASSRDAPGGEPSCGKFPSSRPSRCGGGRSQAPRSSSSPSARLVLVPLLTGLNPSLALLGAGVGTLLFQLITGRQVPIFLGSSFAFITPIIFSIQAHRASGDDGRARLRVADVLRRVRRPMVWKHGAEIVHRYMPPVVVGPIIMIIGLSLAAVGVNMAMGAAATARSSS